ncbi:unnamed protein product [Moneuplotes crassus]|uniref:Uncharacterized protein n=1 Tax=Euplotes crassus TaxID=5936 RepID=A0AAD1UIC0_EUPCR|nr:unnamed protein product [Moneuplotes crassus]
MGKLNAHIFRALESGNQCTSCEHCCINGAHCGSSSECDGTLAMYIVIFVILLICVTVFIVITIVYIKYKKKTKKELERIRRRTNHKGHKVRKRRGIILGRPVSKNIPLKMAELKASIELEKAELLYKDKYQELLDQKPSFELLFERNIKFDRIQGSKIDNIPSSNRPLNTHANVKSKKDDLLFEYTGPTIRKDQRVKMHDFRSKIKSQLKKTLITDLYNISDSPMQKVLKKKKKRKMKKKKKRTKFSKLGDDTAIHKDLALVSNQNSGFEDFDYSNQTLEQFLNENRVNIFNDREYHKDTSDDIENSGEQTRYKNTDMSNQRNYDKKTNIQSRIDDILDDLGDTEKW